MSANTVRWRRWPKSYCGGLVAYRLFDRPRRALGRATLWMADQLGASVAWIVGQQGFPDGGSGPDLGGGATPAPRRTLQALQTAIVLITEALAACPWQVVQRLQADTLSTDPTYEPVSGRHPLAPVNRLLLDPSRRMEGMLWREAFVRQCVARGNSFARGRRLAPGRIPVELELSLSTRPQISGSEYRLLFADGHWQSRSRQSPPMM